GREAIRVQPQRLATLGFGFRPLPIPETNEAQHLMRLRQSVVECHQLVRQPTPLDRIRVAEQPRGAESRHPKAPISQSELRIEFDSAVEMLEGLFVTLVS